MSLDECAIIESLEETGDGVRLEVSLFCSLATGEKLAIAKPERIFIIEEIFSYGESVKEAGQGTTATLMLKARSEDFHEGMILYRENGKTEPKKASRHVGQKRR
ncbi:MAG: hypothetical protein ABIH38_03780 [Patescibacteria group bacterium]